MVVVLRLLVVVVGLPPRGQFDVEPSDYITITPQYTALYHSLLLARRGRVYVQFIIIITALYHITTQYNAVQCSTVQYSVVQCSAVQYSAVQCSTVQYSAVQCSAVQYSAVQYSTVTVR